MSNGRVGRNIFVSQDIVRFASSSSNELPADAFVAMGCKHRLLACDLGYGNAVHRPCHARFALGLLILASDHLEVGTSSVAVRSPGFSRRGVGKSIGVGFSHAMPPEGGTTCARK